MADFDKLLRSAISHLTNCDLSDEQWLPASLPIKMDGLGVRKVSSLALPAYLASAASTASLHNTIFDSARPSEDEVLGVYCQNGSLFQTLSYHLPTKQSF